MLFIIKSLLLSLTMGVPLGTITNGFLNRTVGSIGNLGLADGMEALQKYPGRAIMPISTGRIILYNCKFSSVLNKNFAL